MKNSCVTCFQYPISLCFYIQPPCNNSKFKITELHMYQQDMVSNDISSCILIITIYTQKVTILYYNIYIYIYIYVIYIYYIYIYIFFFFLQTISKINMRCSFLFNVLNLCFSTTMKKTISVDVQMKVKKMNREKYLLNSH